MTADDKRREDGTGGSDQPHTEALLDEALSETFPASDPPAVGSQAASDQPSGAAAQGVAVALIGVSGRVGSRIADELLARGHRVTGIARDAAGVASRPGLTLAAGDATQPASLEPLLVGHDAVIAATRAEGADAAALLAAVRAAGVPRLLVVGGAGSLRVHGTALLDRPGFPPAFAAEARAAARMLETLRADATVEWTYLSPSAELVPGERTGAFRLGGDELLVDRNGRSWISMEDYAAALVDELERPRHRRRRFTVGY